MFDTDSRAATDELNQLYLSAVEAWIMEDPDFTDDAESCSPNLKQLEESMRARGLGILVKLKALETSLENAKWELSLRGVRLYSFVFLLANLS